MSFVVTLFVGLYYKMSFVILLFVGLYYKIYLRLIYMLCSITFKTFGALYYYM
jgi:hypothetical protein